MSHTGKEVLPLFPNLFFLLVYGKTSEFRYFLTLGKSVLGKRMHKSA